MGNDRNSDGPESTIAPRPRFTVAWWRAFLPPRCREWFDTTIAMLDPVGERDARFADAALLALASLTVVDVDRALEDWTDLPPGNIRQLHRWRRRALRERDELEATAARRCATPAQPRIGVASDRATLSNLSAPWRGVFIHIATGTSAPRQGLPKKPAGWRRSPVRDGSNWATPGHFRVGNIQ
jgi:hypothetical protein